MRVTKVMRTGNLIAFTQAPPRGRSIFKHAGSTHVLAGMNHTRCATARAVCRQAERARTRCCQASHHSAPHFGRAGHVDVDGAGGVRYCARGSRGGINAVGVHARPLVHLEAAGRR
eukprot:IDg20225t1